MGHILTCTLFLLQAREISVPTSSRSAFPRALKKIAFPRARVPKTPGTRERESRNAPSSDCFTFLNTKRNKEFFWRCRQINHSYKKKVDIPICDTSRFFSALLRLRLSCQKNAFASDSETAHVCPADPMYVFFWGGGRRICSPHTHSNPPLHP